MNYQSILENTLSEIKARNEKPVLLLHCCCAVCGGYVLNYLKDYFKILAFYYNPNIMPEHEHELRLSELRRLIKHINESSGSDINLIPDTKYDKGAFMAIAEGYENEKEGGKRCEKCIRLRLEKTAALSEIVKSEYFATTLTVSPHKSASFINTSGKEIAANYTAKWLYSDFKKKDGYKKSILIANELSLYRQNYCGCRFAVNLD